MSFIDFYDSFLSKADPNHAKARTPPVPKKNEHLRRYQYSSATSLRQKKKTKDIPLWVDPEDPRIRVKQLKELKEAHKVVKQATKPTNKKTSAEVPAAPVEKPPAAKQKPPPPVKKNKTTIPAGSKPSTPAKSDSTPAPRTRTSQRLREKRDKRAETRRNRKKAKIKEGNEAPKKSSKKVKKLRLVIKSKPSTPAVKDGSSSDSAIEVEDPAPLPIPTTSPQEATGNVPPAPTAQENYLVADPQLNAQLQAADGTPGQPEHVATHDNDDTLSEDEGDTNI